MSTMGNSNGPVPGLEWLHGLIDPVASGGNLGFRLAFAADKLRGTEVLPASFPFYRFINHFPMPAIVWANAADDA